MTETPSGSRCTKVDIELTITARRLQTKVSHQTAPTVMPTTTTRSPHKRQTRPVRLSTHYASRSRRPHWYVLHGTSGLHHRAQGANPSDNLALTYDAQIRAAEDLLTLSRQLKELWLFGGLREVRGTGDAEMQGLGGERARQADEDARAVVTAISSLLKGAI